MNLQLNFMTTQNYTFCPAIEFICYHDAYIQSVCHGCKLQPRLQGYNKQRQKKSFFLIVNLMDGN